MQNVSNEYDLMPDLFSPESFIDETVESGFCLDKFQLFNWGVFNEKVYTLDAQSQSALLTGQNGSGKTTLVDAIVTLLVPNQMRFYNQSSGSTKKKDRSEESYVLGAYGSRWTEDSLAGKTQYLRDTDTISILNGIFYNKQLKSYVSLLQVRYFTGEGLVRIFAVTRQNLTVENIYDFLEKQNAIIDRGNKWKKLLTNGFGTVFCGDSFKKYSETFSQIFGFRSEKALKLFSQIVGLKVLGNLTEFIRQNMLEQTGTEEEFQKLQENYTKLIQCDNEIQKTKLQIELLEKVVTKGHELKAAEEQSRQNELFKQTLPAWKSQNAKELLEQEEKRLSLIVEEEIQKLQDIKAKREKLQNEIDILNANLANNDIARQIQQLELEISSKYEEKRRCQNHYENYAAKAKTVEIDVPHTENQFNKNKEKLDSIDSQLKSKRDGLEERSFELKTAINGINQNIQQIKNELSSLGERNSNIPLENIQIRKRICSALHIEESSLPFAGELIQVKKSEEEWTFAIERLLHNFALTVLVSDRLYKKVTDYVKKNDVGGRLVYLKTEEQVLQRDFYSKENTVPSKLEIKNNNELAQWISNYLAGHFDYICTDDTDVIAKSERALSSTALIKNGLRHEKDDRKKIKENFVQVLGWDNAQKRRLLSSQLDSLSEKLKDSSLESDRIKSEIEKINLKLEACHSLKEFILWNELDFETVAKQIDSLTGEKNKLASSKEIKDLQQKLDLKKAERDAADNDIEKLNREQGRDQGRLNETKSQKEKNDKVWQSYSLSEEETLKNIALLEKAYNLSKLTSIKELTEKHEELSQSLQKKSETLTDKCKNLDKELSRNMTAILRPTEKILQKFSDWGSLFSDFNAGYEYFDDFESLYNRLVKDDLPKYQDQFHKYLHNTLKQDITDFKEHINNRKQEITAAIENLNKSLKSIIYQHNPDTYLQLVATPSADQKIREFKTKLKAAIPDLLQMQMMGAEYEEKLFTQIKVFLNSLQSNDTFRDFVLDVRNWFNFAATENFAEDNRQKQYYNDSASLSGGEKAKLTYTILASAIAYQFGIDRKSPSSFRFVIIDEAFSKSDAANSEYAMKLFKQLDLQLMVVTPLDKINIVEDYISSIHMTENKNTDDSRLISMAIEKYKLEREQKSGQ